MTLSQKSTRFPQLNVLQELQRDVSIQDPAKFMTLDSNRLDRMEWKDTYQIEDFSLPTLVDSPNIHKIFKIQVTVHDSDTNKLFTKTLYFGQPTDYIFSQNRSDRLHKLTMMKNLDNPLHSNYWRAHLCLSGKNFQENFNRLSQYLLTKRFKAAQQSLTRVKPKARGVKVSVQNPIKTKK